MVSGYADHDDRPALLGSQGFLEDRDRRLAVVRRDVVHVPGHAIGVSDPLDLPPVVHAEDQVAAVGVGKRDEAGRQVVRMHRPHLELGVEVLLRGDPREELA
jgi:hypothetical protein